MERFIAPSITVIVFAAFLSLMAPFVVALDGFEDDLCASLEVK